MENIEEMDLNSIVKQSEPKISENKQYTVSVNECDASDNNALLEKTQDKLAALYLAPCISTDDKTRFIQRVYNIERPSFYQSKKPICSSLTKKSCVNLFSSSLNSIEEVMSSNLSPITLNEETHNKGKLYSREVKPFSKKNSNIAMDQESETHVNISSKSSSTSFIKVKVYAEIETTPKKLNEIFKKGFNNWSSSQSSLESNISGTIVSVADKPPFQELYSTSQESQVIPGKSSSNNMICDKIEVDNVLDTQLGRGKNKHSRVKGQMLDALDSTLNNNISDVTNVAENQNINFKGFIDDGGKLITQLIPSKIDSNKTVEKTIVKQSTCPPSIKRIPLNQLRSPLKQELFETKYLMKRCKKFNSLDELETNLDSENACDFDIPLYSSEISELKSEVIDVQYLQRDNTSSDSGTVLSGNDSTGLASVDDELDEVIENSILKFENCRVDIGIMAKPCTSEKSSQTPHDVIKKVCSKRLCEVEEQYSCKRIKLNEARIRKVDASSNGDVLICNDSCDMEEQQGFGTSNDFSTFKADSILTSVSVDGPPVSLSSKEEEIDQWNEEGSLFDKDVEDNELNWSMSANVDEDEIILDQLVPAPESESYIGSLPTFRPSSFKIPKPILKVGLSRCARPKPLHFKPPHQL